MVKKLYFVFRKIQNAKNNPLANALVHKTIYLFDMRFAKFFLRSEVQKSRTYISIENI